MENNLLLLTLLFHRFLSLDRWERDRYYPSSR
jgi:hypothetical protein